jgi:hypothetical protein
VVAVVVLLVCLTTAVAVVEQPHQMALVEVAVAQVVQQAITLRTTQQMHLIRSALAVLAHRAVQVLLFLVLVVEHQHFLADLVE